MQVLPQPSNPSCGMSRCLDADSPLLVECAELLHGQALLSEGLQLPDPIKFSRQVADLMVRTLEPAQPGDSAET